MDTVTLSGGGLNCSCFFFSDVVSVLKQIITVLALCIQLLAWKVLFSLSASEDHEKPLAGQQYIFTFLLRFSILCHHLICRDLDYP